MIVGAGLKHVINVSGGFASLSGYVPGFDPGQFPPGVACSRAKKLGAAVHEEKPAAAAVVEEKKVESNEPLVVDVRSVEEFSYGAYPGAINIPLDELEMRVDELGKKDRKIILYCASGGRSSYAVQMLRAYGFTNLENGGG